LTQSDGMRKPASDGRAQQTVPQESGAARGNRAETPDDLKILTSKGSYATAIRERLGALLFTSEGHWVVRCLWFGVIPE
jgi:hypothetical protein